MENSVQDFKICPRCVCMQCNLIDDDLIRKKESNMKITLGERWPSIAEFLKTFVIDDDIVCRSCIGLLQDNFLESIAEKVTDAFNLNGYDCENFKLSISLPVQSVLFIENARNVHDEAIKSIRYSGRGYALKEIVKVYVEPTLEKKLAIKAVSKGKVDLDIAVTLQHDESEERLLPQIAETFMKCFSKAVKQNSYSKKRKASIFNSTTLGNVVEVISQSELKSLIVPAYFACPMKVDTVTLLRTPIYLGGRYCKMSRDLSQTPWVVDGKRISEMSVQEYITLPTIKLFQADGCNFSSSGREDIDVRMLGNGRPFLLEVANARRIPPSDEISALEKEINESTGLIQVYKMTMVSKEDIKLLKDGEEEKTKSYSALCYSLISTECPRENILSKLEELSKMKNVKLQQKTPIRVLHRRNLAIRERQIHTISVSVTTVEEVQKMVTVNAECADKVVPFKLDITTQAGTYVKEFVHGDFGRTVPNLSTLIGATTDILCLDVLSVNLEWPPQQ